MSADEGRGSLSDVPVCCCFCVCPPEFNVDKYEDYTNLAADEMNPEVDKEPGGRGGSGGEAGDQDEGGGGGDEGGA